MKASQKELGTGWTGNDTVVWKIKKWNLVPKVLKILYHMTHHANVIVTF